jgi:hypothetical protein
MLQPMGEPLAQVDPLPAIAVHYYTHTDVRSAATEREYPGVTWEEASVEEDVNLRVISNYTFKIGPQGK